MLREYFRQLNEQEKETLNRQILEAKATIPKTIIKTILLFLFLIGLLTVGLFFQKIWVIALLLFVSVFVCFNLYYNISEIIRLPKFLTQKREVIETGTAQVTEILIDKYIKIENYNDEGEYFIVEHNNFLSLIGGQDFSGVKKLKSKIEQVVIMNKEKNGIFYDNIKKTGNSIEPLCKIKKIPLRLLESEIWTNLTDRKPFKGNIEDVQKYLQE